MIQTVETENSDLFAVKATGTLDKADYDQLLPALEAKIKQHGKINLYWEMTNFDGWEPAGFWQDIKFDVTHANSFQKVAIVGDQKWEDWMTQALKPFTSAQVRFFPAEESAQAMLWVTQ
ncbi:SpoIIAA family protein [Rufibacter immobilis]|nr:STAS/SEC14 domain-containing protein [Rufibacter immobilis]